MWPKPPGRCASGHEAPVGNRPHPEYLIQPAGPTDLDWCLRHTYITCWPESRDRRARQMLHLGSGKPVGHHPRVPSPQKTIRAKGSDRASAPPMCPCSTDTTSAP